MNRKDKVYFELKKMCENITVEEILNGFNGFETIKISEQVGINRNNASKELNELVSEGRIVKLKGRPVNYFAKEVLKKKLNLKDQSIHDVYEDMSLKNFISQKENNQTSTDAFESLQGYRGALDKAIKQAKAAIVYPPKGLHTLITGDTGVGKTTFAEAMYRYAIESEMMDKESKFIIFNCAEYADNPQLVLSMLFGHIKGAFTGADQEKKGLVESANNGVLLLDEIHRLTPESQEMLFMLIDKGLYRKLGETDDYKKSDVFIIGATTEDINSNLLKTFTRRIPMVITLPNLNEWNLAERHQIIKQFFEDQSAIIGKSIRVSYEVINSLILYDCVGNIGQLRSDIQLLCARGYLEHKLCDKNFIEIESNMLPEHISKGLLKYDLKRYELNKLLPVKIEQFVDFYSEDKSAIKDNQSNIENNLYIDLKNKYLQYQERGFTKKEIQDILNEYIEKYIKLLIDKYHKLNNVPSTNEIFKIVSPRIYNAVERAFLDAQLQFKKVFSNKIKISLMMHVSALVERLSSKEYYEYRNTNNIILDYQEEYLIAKKMIEVINQELGIQIPHEEIGIITMLLGAIEDETDNAHVGLIIMSHGKSTASSIAEVANSLLGTSLCKSIDMPLDEKVESTLNKAIDLVKKTDQGKGVIILVDMGSLIAFGEIISKKLNKIIYCIEMVSTPIAIEVLRKCMITSLNIDEIVKDISKIHPYIGRDVIRDTKSKALNDEERTIATTCITGIGTAVKLEKLIKSSLKITDELNIKIKPYNLNDKVSDDENIIAVVGAIDLKIPFVPYISLDELILEDGFKRLEKIIYDTEINDSYHFKGIKSSNSLIIKTLNSMLNFLDSNRIYDLALMSFNEIIKKIDCDDMNRKKLTYIIHIANMVERILKRESFQFDVDLKKFEKNQELYDIIANSLKDIQEYFKISVPDTEMIYLLEMLDTQEDS